jgi:hypothetical protein
VETDLSSNSDGNLSARIIKVQKAIQLQNLLLRCSSNSVDIHFFVAGSLECIVLHFSPLIVQCILKITIGGTEDYKWCKTIVTIDVENILFHIIISC